MMPPAFTQQQWDDLLACFEPLTPRCRIYIEGQLSCLFMSFDIGTKIAAYEVSQGRPEHPKWKEHRARLQKTYNAAFELRALLRQERVSALLLGFGPSLHRPLEQDQAISSAFSDLLDTLLANVTLALTEDQALAILRCEAVPRQGRKSRVRRELWEPTFHIWLTEKGEIGFSEGGPLQRAISIMHDALGLATPEPGTLKKAVRTWRKEAGMTGA
jgi:hypothetical protein